MSQFAFYMQKKQLDNSTKIIHNCRAHNGFELLDIFDISICNTISQKILLIIFHLLISTGTGFVNKIIKAFFKIFNISVIFESDYKFNERFLSSMGGIRFYYGGWHCEKYFVQNRSELINRFDFKKINDQTNNKYIEKIDKTNSVSVHVRRGDYLVGVNADFFGNVCTLKYYEKAFEIIESKVSSPHYYIFSDDIEWVRKNIIRNNVTYIDCNRGIDSWKDMYLMTRCAHHIVSNSTFSWWGAWLNTNSGNITICPFRFTKDDIETQVYPDNWYRVYEY